MLRTMLLLGAERELKLALGIVAGLLIVLLLQLSQYSPWSAFDPESAQHLPGLLLHLLLHLSKHIFGLLQVSAHHGL